VVVKANAFSKSAREKIEKAKRQGGGSCPCLILFQNVFKIPDLRKKVLFTLLIDIHLSCGRPYPTPGINSGILAEFWRSRRTTCSGCNDMFVGGAFGKATVFRHGRDAVYQCFHYIQLLATVFPYFS